MLGKNTKEQIKAEKLELSQIKTLKVQMQNILAFQKTQEAGFIKDKEIADKACKAAQLLLKKAEAELSATEAKKDKIDLNPIIKVVTKEIPLDDKNVGLRESQCDRREGEISKQEKKLAIQEGDIRAKLIGMKEVEAVSKNNVKIAKAQVKALMYEKDKIDLTPVTEIKEIYVEREVIKTVEIEVPIDDKDVAKREAEVDAYTEKYLELFANLENKKSSMDSQEAGIKALKREVKILIGENKLDKKNLKYKEFLK